MVVSIEIDETFTIGLVFDIQYFTNENIVGSHRADEFDFAIKRDNSVL